MGRGASERTPLTLDDDGDDIESNKRCCRSRCCETSEGKCNWCTWFLLILVIAAFVHVILLERDDIISQIKSKDQ
eukprot:8431021-Ditylum_brightwellii.AAC.1